MTDERFSGYVMPDHVREHRRDIKRRAAARGRADLQQLIRLAAGAVGAVLLLWQVTWMRPTPALVAVGFGLAVVGIHAILIPTTTNHHPEERS